MSNPLKMSSDPRGPIRKIMRVETLGGGVQILLDCLHRSNPASHFAYRVGESYRCMKCLDPIERAEAIRKQTGCSTVAAIQAVDCEDCQAPIVNGKCDCAGMSDMIDAGLEMSGTRKGRRS